MHQATCFKMFQHMYIYIYVCVQNKKYIYIYTGNYCRSPVDDSLRLPAKMQKWVLPKVQETQRRLFSNQLGITWLVPPGQTIWNKCVFRCDFNCSLAAIISVQLPSTEHWHYPRLSVQCFQRCVHVQGTLSSHPQPHPTPPRPAPWSP